MGFDVATGKLQYQLPDQYNLDTMSFDSKNNVVVGTGLRLINATDFARTVSLLSSR